MVAVLSYTGFDMEDAMILNKSSVERGMFHASVYKTETIDLRDEKSAKMVFAPEPQPPHMVGRPAPGSSSRRSAVLLISSAHFYACATSIPFSLLRVQMICMRWD